MNKEKLTLIGVASLILTELREPMTLKDLSARCFKVISSAGEGSAFIFERASTLLVNLSQITKLNDGRLLAHRKKFNKDELVLAALS